MPTRHNKNHSWEKPSDKYAQSEQALPNREPEDQISESGADDVVLEASEESFPASDPPAYAKRRKDREAERPTQERAPDDT